MNTKLFNIIDAGHTYQVKNHESETAQTIAFIKKEVDPDAKDETTMRTVQEGTTNEAVISVLIDRLQTLNERFPSQFNEDAIKHLHLAYEALFARTQDREARGVEGTHQQ